MDTLLNRYRNITFLALVIVAQLLLLAYQVKSEQDVRLIRVWAVTAVTPVARLIESVRSSTAGFVGNYFSLRDIRGEHKQLQEEVARLKMENLHLREELSTADRARSLAAFQSRSQSRTVAARVIGTGAGTGSSVRYVDRGIEAGVRRGMAVVTPDGIVGKVTAVYPLASQVLLITDSNFGAGVISQKSRQRGTLRGMGHSCCRVENIENEAKVEKGEMFYATGDDRIFPKGFPVGTVKAVRSGSTFQEILLDASGLRHGIEEVLIILEGVHQQIPEAAVAASPVVLMPPPPPEPGEAPATNAPAAGTEADRLRDRYRATGEAQGHKFGEGTPGSRPPDFTSISRPTGTMSPSKPAPAVAQQAPPVSQQQIPPAPQQQAPPAPQPPR